MKENKVKDAVIEEPKKEELDPKEVIKDLMIQEKHHAEKEEHHRTMRIKARGALEIVTQMHHQEETNQ